MFIQFFYMLRYHGFKVTFNEWMLLMEALDQGLAQNSLLGFYYVSRAILVKTEADFDRFDQVFLEYFESIQHFEEIPAEFFKWLEEPKEAKPYDRDEVDRRTNFDLEKLCQMLEERLEEQYWPPRRRPILGGKRGTSVLGHSGYAKTGIRVGGEGGMRHALQVAGDREFRDFWEDNTLDLRSFQMAFRHLRQYTTQEDGRRISWIWMGPFRRPAETRAI